MEKISPAETLCHPANENNFFMSNTADDFVEINSSLRLHLDFTEMIVSDDGRHANFPVNYLRDQLDVPEIVDDSYLVGGTKIINGIVCADRTRTRAMIRRALDSGWIKSVPDYIWRFSLVNNSATSVSSENYQCYMLMPGTRFGTVLIRGEIHAKKIIDLARRGYYATYRLDYTTSDRPDYGVAISDEVILISEAQSKYA